MTSFHNAVGNLYGNFAHLQRNVYVMKNTNYIKNVKQTAVINILKHAFYELDVFVC